jgi:ATP-dependent Lhr-like helicase
MTVPATRFVDCVLRWQRLQLDAPSGDETELGPILERLEGVLLPAESWEQTVLPARLPDYQPRMLDDLLVSGEWLWVAQGQTENDAAGTLEVALLRRSSLACLGPSRPFDSAVLDTDSGQIWDCLQAHGALFVTDLVQRTGLAPHAVRLALDRLVRHGMVTNDRFDVLRNGHVPRSTAREADWQLARQVRPPGLPHRAARSTRTARQYRPEGRWCAIAWGGPDTETQAVFQARLLLARYGIAARELARMDPWLLPWRVLYEVLSRMELAGEVRRGYFAEGLSGAQFALPQAVQLLQEFGGPSARDAPAVLLHSLDPANLYGAGAPLDIALLDGGTRTLPRRAGNWLVLRAGRPVLILEQQGRRVTALASASREDVTAAVACLPQLLRNAPRGAARRLSIETWNDAPVTASAARELLERVGFVRDYQSMTLYGAWN